MIVFSIIYIVTKITNGPHIEISKTYLNVGIGGLWNISIDFNISFQYWLYF